MKRFKIVILLVLFMGAFWSFVQAEDQSVEFWSSLPEPDHTQMVKLIDAYNTTHTTQPIHYTNFTKPSELLTALKENTLPDIALIDSEWINAFKDKMVPADDVLKDAGSMVRAVAETDTFKPIWQRCVVDGKDYAIPFSAETAALVFNMRYFTKTPKIYHYKQLEKLSAALRKKYQSISMWPVMLPLSWEKGELGELWTGFAGSLTKTPLNLYDETAALNVWWNWVNRLKMVPMEQPPLPQGFIHAASWVLLPRQLDGLNDKFAVQLLPKAKRPWGYLHVDALAFFKSKRGWDFANYLTDYPQIKQWAMTTPTVPVNKQVYLSPDYLQEIDSSKPWMRTYIAAINRVYSPIVFASPEERQAIEELLLKGLSNELTVQAAALKIHEEKNRNSQAALP